MYRFPEAELQAQRPARLYTDRYGNVIRAELGDDDAWRFPVSLGDVSPHVVNATLAVEDRRFWDHGGIDWVAVMRAAVLDLYCGRIVSGASTVTMQLAKLAKPEPRSFPTKFRQALRALDAEEHHDKRWILENYLNLAPYGSNIVGIESAARYYFAKPARDLNLQESALLAGLPQRPAALRPDRYPQAASKRQDRVLERMVACGHASADEAYAAGPISDGIRGALACPPTTASECPPDGTPHNKLGHPMTEPHFCSLASTGDTSNSSQGSTIRTTLDPTIQTLARTTVRAQAHALANVDDGAVVVIENASRAVRALVGTIDFDAEDNGQVNAACARRSPGSALKPFIYLLAIESGIIVPQTILSDRPLDLSNYRPANFDHTNRTAVSAREALCQSLNTPAVRLLRTLGPQRLIQTLDACGVRTLDRGAAEYGLALALGGGEVTLLELTNAYAGLARGGSFAPCRFVETDAPTGDEVRPFAPSSVELLVDMLGTYPLPGCPEIALAWKTGTSNGHRDAWCIASNRDFTVGLWLGNKDGRPSRSLVGATAAAPAVAAIFQGLYRQKAHPPRPIPTHTRQTTICAHTGLTASPTCRETLSVQAVPGIPLRVCAGDCTQPPASAATPSTEQLRILSPEPGTYRATGGETVRLELHAEAEAAIAWFLDGRHVATQRRAVWLDLPRGKHVLTCTSLDSGQTGRVQVAIR